VVATALVKAIAVTGLYPGMMKTDMFSKMGIEKDMGKGLNTEEVTNQQCSLKSGLNILIIKSVES
jgi:hypothetical protein